MERKEYEAPKVTRIEIGFEDRIIAAGCDMAYGEGKCGVDVMYPNQS